MQSTERHVPASIFGAVVWAPASSALDHFSIISVLLPAISVPATLAKAVSVPSVIGYQNTKYLSQVTDYEKLQNV
uniref:Uncharacterized protein n=1 Tax=Romanomermis culicivorax TaxID=13658 RepID=A0A915IRP8_ROMCU